MKNHRGLLYGILVALLLVMGVWWIYFLTTETGAMAQFEKQKMANDRLHALFLLQANPHTDISADSVMAKSFPNLLFTRTDRGIQVIVDPVFLKSSEDKANSTRNMFLYEGLFFLTLLVAGSTILVFSWRSESRFVQTRELFLAGATHEFKTPLASLRLYTETLGREGLKEKDQKRIQERMVEDIVRLENLVDEILAMSANDTFSPGPWVTLDLVQVCQSVLDEMKSYFNDNQASVSFHHQEKHFSKGHEVALALAFRNLLVNAIKHNKDQVKIELSLETKGSWNVLTVSDNGCGIPKRLHDKVFDCFYSQNSEQKPSSGSGVGLYLVQRNVTNMNGKIKIDSDQDMGCTFTISLPVYQGESS
ncbi:MAG: HAMP domain-containing histidine kinase [bacterium]|nr:HAMP domain-containing histidine kinase [bacterium]